MWSCQIVYFQPHQYETLQLEPLNHLVLVICPVIFRTADTVVNLIQPVGFNPHNYRLFVSIVIKFLFFHAGKNGARPKSCCDHMVTPE